MRTVSFDPRFDALGQIPIFCQSSPSLGRIYYAMTRKGTIFASIRFFDVQQSISDRMREDGVTEATAKSRFGATDKSVTFRHEKPLMVRVAPKDKKYKKHAHTLWKILSSSLPSYRGIPLSVASGYIPASLSTEDRHFLSRVIHAELSQVSSCVSLGELLGVSVRVEEERTITAEAAEMTEVDAAESPGLVVSPCPRCRSHNTRRTTLHNKRQVQVCGDCRVIIPLEDMDLSIDEEGIE